MYSSRRKPRMLPLLTTKISLSFLYFIFPFFYILRNKYSQISSCYLYCLGNSVCYCQADTINNINYIETIQYQKNASKLLLRNQVIEGWYRSGAFGMFGRHQCEIYIYILRQGWMILRGRRINFKVGGACCVDCKSSYTGHMQPY